MLPRAARSATRRSRRGTGRWAGRWLVALSMLAATTQAFPQEEVGRRERKKIAIDWATYETSKKSYEIRYESVIPGATVKKVGVALEDVLVEYVKVFRHKPSEPLRVKFLDSLNTYEQEGGDPSHPGKYFPATHELILLQRPFYDLIPTAYHEAFHQYLADFLGQETPVPIWFNEGMAVYFEGIQEDKRSKKLDFRRIDNRKIRMVQQALMTRTAIPLAELVDADHEKFHDKKRESLYYTQSFAVVYFLMRGLGGRPAIKYLKELRTTKDPEQANETLFGKERKKLERFEKRWKTYTLRLKLTEGAEA